MVKRAPKKPPEGAHMAEKPEDKEWKKWFDKLDKKEHENYLRKLGLDDEDIEAYVTARIKGLMEGQPLMVDTTYHVQVGIQKQMNYPALGTNSVTSSLEEPIPFDVVLYAQDMEIEHEWQQRCLFNPNNEPSSIEFKIVPQQPGTKQIRIEIFYRNHWLTRIKYDAVVQWK